jgi:N6-L-threonylcarbamoyladenine synthase
MKILSIETSCDETAISLLSISKNKIAVLGDALHSQIELHKQYGGVFPMMAKREHQKNLCPLLIRVLKESNFFKVSKSQATISKENKLKKILERETDLVQHFFKDIINIQKPKIDLIAVTKGPGLEPALWVGISFAKALGALWDIPVIGVNHMEGHIVSVLVNKHESSKSQISSIQLNKKNQFPALSLLVSGGHTELVLVKDWGKYKVIGKTKDDAVGEAFDKVARILGLPYPGGPQISALAEQSRKQNKSVLNLAHNSLLTTHPYSLPRPMMYTKDFDFSFSGLKTAVLYMTQKIPEMREDVKKEIAREFEDSCVDVLIHKTKKAIEEFNVKTLIVGGGVSANNHLRNNLKILAKNLKIDLHIPDKKLATDNAIMIGVAGYLQSQRSKKRNGVIKAEGHLSL